MSWFSLLLVIVARSIGTPTHVATLIIHPPGEGHTLARRLPAYHYGGELAI